MTSAAAGAPSTTPPTPMPPVPPRHTPFDDAQALFTGTLFVAMGVLLFRHAGLVTGGTAGIAFVAHYALGWSFGAVFFAINLPFYAAAWLRMGRLFTIKTFAAVALLSAATEWLPGVLTLARVDPLFAAIGGGLLSGAGMLMLFRHRASLGGLNVLVLWLQDKRGWRAGKVQLAIDVSILLASSPWLTLPQLLLSVLGAAALNVTLAVNHRPGRYLAM